MICKGGQDQWQGCQKVCYDFGAGCGWKRMLKRTTYIYGTIIDVGLNDKNDEGWWWVLRNTMKSIERGTWVPRRMLNTLGKMTCTLK